MSDRPTGRDTFGAMRPSGFKTFRAGTTHTAAMTAPTSAGQHTAYVDQRSSRTEFVVRSPNAVTAYTIHYGRWVEGPVWDGTGTELSGWVEDGTLAVTGAADGELVSVVFPNNGDRAGVYVTDLTGTVDVDKTFKFWLRGLP